ncbi:MAG: EamA-like transporter family protein [Promethearchaeota archaeon]|nr:MAG: EamA-like transporter family protein [Candidatus Lokiarchaeota archaeon]
MSEKDTFLKKGTIFGIISAILIGLEPIVANLRLITDVYIDPVIFATMTAFFEAVIFLPIYLNERRNLNKLREKEPLVNDNIESKLNGWKMKKNIALLLSISIVFSVVPVLLYIGFEEAGNVNASLTLKTEIIFSMLYGHFILNEKITKIQILFSGVLFIGLILAVTQGSFNLLEFNIGVLILLIDVAIFTFMHTLTKKGLDRKEITPIQVVFIRNLFSSVFLLIFYIFIFPGRNISILLDPRNYLFFTLMAFTYGFALLTWYKTLSFIEIGRATIIVSITPIITAFFSFIIYGEILTLYHIIGTIIVISSIYMIVREDRS